MTRIVFSMCIALALPLGVQAQEGTWKLVYAAGSNENALAIVKLGSDELVAGSPRVPGLKLKSQSIKEGAVRLALKTDNVELVFEGTAPAGAKRITGVLVLDETTLFPAWLIPTQDEKIEIASSMKPLDCPPLTQAKKLETRVATLRNQIAFTKDAEKRKELIKQYTEADQLAKKEAPALYRAVIEKHADNPAVFQAIMALLTSSDAKPDEIRTWATTALNSAKAYGPRYQGEISGQLTQALLKVEGQSKLALEYAQQAEMALTPTSSADQQVRVLGTLSRALRKNGDLDGAKATDARAEKFELVLDKAYSAKMPGFTGEKFAGRKGKSDRAVFMELFTGATCPPCVAADLAFDVLQKTYTPRELVLLQYHMHIPGPDPMTNPDTEGRWAYYRKAYPDKIKGVPSSLFNGKPAAAGGGGVANAEKKYQAYREVIDPLLEANAAAKLTANAVRKGERVDIDVNVDFGAPGTEKKLRILVVEETVRYLGSNKIRLHHNVVRACPTGIDGTPLTEASSKHKASVELGDLRGKLTKYLDTFEMGGRSFQNPARPMSMENLRVIAFVQDDMTHEILQAVQVDVERK